MDIPPSLAQQTLKLIQSAKNIIIISHRNPDADTIGSNLALRHLLEAQGKKVISACIDPITNQISFLVSHEYQTHFTPEQCELLICVDAGSPAQLGFLKTQPDLLSKKIPVINIDHHTSNEGYGTINLVYPQAASTTLILYFLFQIWKVKMNPFLATCLLYGLYYDTGSFMHSNTNEEVYGVAAELLKQGADFKKIVKEVFHQHSIEKLKLWGKVFSEAQISNKNVVVSGISHKDLQNMNTTLADLSGSIDYLSMVKGNSFATILSEDGKGHVRGSLRTKENHLNLSEIASMFGGGGHRKASGFTLSGELKKETRWSIKE